MIWKGTTQLWLTLTKNAEGVFIPPVGRVYLIGVDVSSGTGSSNSALSTIDKATGEKVMQYVNPYIRPEAFAVLSVAFARWFNNAMLCWESNGPGRQFGAKVMELKYTHVYHRRREESMSKKTSDIPGFASTKDAKLVLLGRYSDAIESGRFINRSEDSLNECLEYVFAQNGGVIHSQEEAAEDPSGARANHGDRVIADALAWFLTSDSKIKKEKFKIEPPVGSLAWRIARKGKEEEVGGRELLHSDGWGS